MANINPVSAETKEKIRRKSAFFMPDNPTAAGWKPEDIRKAFVAAIIDNANSAISEIDRLVEELNQSMSFKEDAGTSLQVEFDRETNLLHVKLQNKDGTILSDCEADMQVQTTNIKDGAVTEQKIADGAVTEDKLKNALSNMINCALSGVEFDAATGALVFTKNTGDKISFIMTLDHLLVTQSTGTSESLVMSQKATTEAIASSITRVLNTPV